jgi:hypothetical protein
MSTHLNGILPQPDDSCAVLAVNLDDEDIVSLAQLLGGSSWMLQKAGSCRKAVALSHNTRAAVVLCAPGDARRRLQLAVKQTA